MVNIDPIFLHADNEGSDQTELMSSLIRFFWRIVTLLGFSCRYSTPGRRQSKTPILSRNVDQKSLETEFSIDLCRHAGDKKQSKTLFLAIFDLCSSIVKSVFDCRLPGVMSLSVANLRFFFVECCIISVKLS